MKMCARVRYVTYLIIFVLLFSTFISKLNGKRHWFTGERRLKFHSFNTSENISHHVQDLANLANYPWQGDAQCGHLDVKFAERDSLPVIPLVSFPGSGVTWFRQMIEGLTGLYTSSVYPKEKPILLKGHHGNELNSSCMCTILEKTHGATMGTNLKQYFQLLYKEGSDDLNKERGVLLLRNPLDAAIAFRNFHFAGKTGTARADEFYGSDWNDYVVYAAFAWTDLAVRWIEKLRNGTVVFYENLVHNTEAELKRIIPHIYSKPIDPLRWTCTLKHRDRKDWKRLNRTKVALTDEQKMLFQTAIDAVQGKLRQRNWPPLP